MYSPFDISVKKGEIKIYTAKRRQKKIYTAKREIKRQSRFRGERTLKRGANKERINKQRRR